MPAASISFVLGIERHRLVDRRDSVSGRAGIVFTSGQAVVPQLVVRRRVFLPDSRCRRTRDPIGCCGIVAQCTRVTRNIGVRESPLMSVFGTPPLIKERVGILLGIVNTSQRLYQQRPHFCGVGFRGDVHRIVSDLEPFGSRHIHSMRMHNVKRTEFQTPRSEFYSVVSIEPEFIIRVSRVSYNQIELRDLNHLMTGHFTDDTDHHVINLGTVISKRFGFQFKPETISGIEAVTILDTIAIQFDMASSTELIRQFEVKHLLFGIICRTKYVIFVVVAEFIRLNQNLTAERRVHLDSEVGFGQQFEFDRPL